MSTAGVALDDWKLPVFKQVLDEASYSYKQAPGLMPGIVTLMVEYEDIDLSKLEDVIRKANKQAAKNKFELKRRKRNNENSNLH